MACTWRGFGWACLSCVLGVAACGRTLSGDDQPRSLARNYATPSAAPQTLGSGGTSSGPRGDGQGGGGATRDRDAAPHPAFDAAVDDRDAATVGIRDAAPVEQDASADGSGDRADGSDSTLADAAEGGLERVRTSFDGGAVTVEEYQLPPGHEPLGITTGADGNVWFVDRRVDSIGRLTLSGKLTEFAMPTKGLSPEFITTSHAGSVWYGSYATFGRVGVDGTLTEYPSSTIFFPYSLTVDAQDDLWFADSNAIGRRTPSGVVTLFPAPASQGYANDLGSIVVGPDGNLWCFQEVEQDLLRMTPTGQYTVFPIAADLGLAAGPDGNLWATSFLTPAVILKITTAGVVKDRYTVPGADFSIGYISPGPDGALWFTVGNHTPGAIGRITTSGDIEQFVLPDPATYMAGFAVTADGSLWFTEGDLGRVGRVILHG